MESATWRIAIHEQRDGGKPDCLHQQRQRSGSRARIDGGNGTSYNTSTAGNGTFTNNGGHGQRPRRRLANFDDTSTAGNGTFTNKVARHRQTFFTAPRPRAMARSPATAARSAASRPSFEELDRRQWHLHQQRRYSRRLDNISTPRPQAMAPSPTTAARSAAHSAAPTRSIETLDRRQRHANRQQRRGRAWRVFIRFIDDSGGTARVEVFGNGDRDIS